MRKSRSGNQKHIDRNKEWNQNNREHINSKRRASYAKRKLECPEKLVSDRRVEKLKQRYGLTPDQHDQLFASQNYRCAICLSEDPGSKTGWHTDHDHATGEVRGILCHHCNLMLGAAKDTTSTLTRAASYLESCKWKKAA